MAFVERARPGAGSRVNTTFPDKSRQLRANVFPSRMLQDAVPRREIALAGLLVAVGDAASVEVVRRELDLHAVPWKDPDVVAAHLAADVAEHLVLVVELHLEH